MYFHISQARKGTVYSKKEREYYNAYRFQVMTTLGITRNEYNYFRRIGDQLNSIYVESCNGTIDEQTYENKTNVFYEKADKKAIQLKLYIFYQTDPRGASIYLDTEPIKDNNYNRSCCIY